MSKKIEFREDDPIYYKVKLGELINCADENGLRIEVSDDETGTSIWFHQDLTGECTRFKIKNNIIK